MPVNSKHPAYEDALATWTRCRDAFRGGDAVKAAGTRYLPALAAHEEQAQDYEKYLARALFFNATRRTVIGLTGALFQRPPTIDVPANVADHAADITLTGVPFETFALTMAQEVLTVGRYGILVEMSSEDSPAKRPYWCGFFAEDIVNWRTERVFGDETLTMVVLHETVALEEQEDPFVSKTVSQYRVCALIKGVYTQQRWRETRPGNGKWEPFEGELIPRRRGEPLNFIPFVFVGPTTITPDVHRPPLDDLVQVNLSHYRNSADMEHGLHFTGIPIPWISGAVAKDGDLKLGPSTMIEVSENGSVGIIQADGKLLGALVEALERKQKMMATLGARLLEDSGGPAETATAVGMRHSGEHATLRTMAEVFEQALTACWRWHAWWMGTEETPADVDAKATLNKEFFAIKASAEDVKALLLLVQSDEIAYATFYEGLQKGGWVREGVTADEEQEEIQTDSEMSAEGGGEGTPLPVPDPGASEGESYAAQAGDELIEEGNPWEIVKRGRKFLVVQSITNRIVGTHDTKEAALAHLRALEANVEE